MMATNLSCKHVSRHICISIHLIDCFFCFVISLDYFLIFMLFFAFKRPLKCIPQSERKNVDFLQLLDLLALLCFESYFAGMI